MPDFFKRRFRNVEPDESLLIYVKEEERFELWKNSPGYLKVYQAFFKNQKITGELLDEFSKTAWYNDELKKWADKQKLLEERKQKEILAENWQWKTEVRNGVSIQIMEFASIKAHRAYVEIYGSVPECLTIDGEVRMIVFRVKEA